MCILEFLKNIHVTYDLVKGDIMSLLQETCDAITGRSHEIEQHIIDNWNTGSPVEQYGRLVNMVAQ